MTSQSKQVYTYTAAKGVISQRVQTVYVYEVASSVRDIKEYDMKGERPTITMSLEADTNTRETNKIGPNMIYQEDITDYMKRSIYSNKNLRNSCTVIWKFYNKQLQNSIEIKVKYETKIQDNPIELLKSIKILMHELEPSKYPLT